jgi:Domain of unknown function (DUF4184)
LPFTLAHPAAVLPFKRWLPFSALVAGSLAPDFHYFLSLAPDVHFRHFSHSKLGAFLFCLPVGLALLWIFQRWMKLPLISLAPEAHQQRLGRFAPPFSWGPATRFLLILCALLIGIFSHLAWDAFTHDGGFFVRNVPDLRAPALEEWGSHRPLFNMLQHASTLLGMTLLIVWYWLWFKRTPPQPVPPNLKLKAGPRRWVTAVILGIAGSVAFMDAYSVSNHLASRIYFAGTFAIMFMSLIFVGTLGFSLWWQWKKSDHRVIGSSGDHPVPPKPGGLEDPVGGRETQASISDGPMSR